MQLFDVGPRAFHKAIGVATLALTPFVDRANIIRRVLIDAPSANDVWVVSCGGRELARFPIYTIGNQQMLGGSAASYPKAADLFQFIRLADMSDLIFPCPQGLTFSVASVGGATADITYEYTEHSPGDVGPSLVNHPLGSHFLLPVFLVPPNNVTHASGVNEDNFTTQIAASWIPNFFGQNDFPAGYVAQFLAFFFEGAGVNTFSGAANHTSTTDHVALIRNGLRMFTRDAADGIPLVGPAAAAGSANTIYGAVNTAYPAFQLVADEPWQLLQTPFRLNGGDQYQFLLGTSGDSTGGADYHLALQALLLDLVVSGGTT